VSRDRRNGQKAPGKLPPSAQAAIDVAWLDVLAARHRDVRWTLVPRERGQGNATAAAGEIVGTFPAPEGKHAILNRNGSAGSPNGSDHDGVDSGGE
jgi:hypothetical protein